MGVRYVDKVSNRPRGSFFGRFAHVLSQKKNRSKRELSSNGRSIGRSDGKLAKGAEFEGRDKIRKRKNERINEAVCNGRCPGCPDKTPGCQKGNKREERGEEETKIVMRYNQVWNTSPPPLLLGLREKLRDCWTEGELSESLCFAARVVFCLPTKS